MMPAPARRRKGRSASAGGHDSPVTAQTAYSPNAEISTKTGRTIGGIGPSRLLEAYNRLINVKDTGPWAQRVSESVVLRLGTIVLGVGDVDRAVSFWSRVLDYEPIQFPDADNGFTILVPPTRVGTRLALQRAETPPEDHPRVHLDLVADDAAEQASEIERLIRLGATRVPWDSYPPDPDFVVLADPEGNRFCIVDASHG